MAKFAYIENAELRSKAEDALVKSIDMWKTIKDKQIRRKLDYFVDQDTTPLSLCYLCHFVSKIAKDLPQYEDCIDFCPVEHWENSSSPYAASTCSSPFSVYADYAECPTNINRYDAFKVADDIIVVLTRALNELKGLDDI